MSLNHELTALGAEFRREAATAPDYRLFVLSDTKPAKPGLVRAPGFRGPGVPGEVWAVPASHFGSFVAQIPAPLGIGKVTLENNQTASGSLRSARRGGCHRDYRPWRLAEIHARTFARHRLILLRSVSTVPEAAIDGLTQYGMIHD